MTPDQFRDKRLQLGLTQAGLAKRLGYKDLRTISRKERAIQPITARDAIAIMSLRKAKL